MIETDKAYIAGFIDGEGCIGIYQRHKGKDKGHYEPKVSIGQSNKEILEKILKMMDNLKSSYVSLSCKGTIGNRTKDYYQLNIFRLSSIKELLEEIYPYLILKQKQAEIMLNFVNHRLTLKNKVTNNLRGYGDFDKECYLQLKKLKK